MSQWQGYAYKNFHIIRSRRLSFKSVKRETVKSPVSFSKIYAFRQFLTYLNIFSNISRSNALLPGP